jgi:hypothetical protein
LCEGLIIAVGRKWEKARTDETKERMNEGRNARMKEAKKKKQTNEPSQT